MDSEDADLVSRIQYYRDGGSSADWSAIVE
jgi:hypothetical protein